jgi:membrane-associated phospholipid phosphatase
MLVMVVGQATLVYKGSVAKQGYRQAAKRIFFGFLFEGPLPSNSGSPGAAAVRHACRTLSRLTDFPDSNPTGTGWLGQVGSRMRVFWLTKMVGTMAIMTAFFVVYFWLLNHTRSPVTTIPQTFLDRLIPFQPWALALYVSLWLYVPLAPALITERRELLSYGWATGALSAAGFAVFILWPTTIPKADIDWSQHPSVSYLKAVDASGNAFPSLHVAFAVFTALWFARILREMESGAAARFLNWLWCLGIIYSTLATRQHVALDAVAGAALGSAFAVLHMRILGALRAREAWA